MESLRRLIEFLINVITFIVELCKTNIFLSWSLYLFILSVLLSAFSVIWNLRGGDKK